MTEPCGTPTWLARVLLRDIESTCRQLNAYPDEDSIWETPPGVANSAGTLALHIAGNLQHFIGARLGESGYVRDRDAEFALRNVARSELLADLDRAFAAVEETLEQASDEDLQQVFPDAVGGVHLPTGQFLLHLATHLAYHIGQLDYHRRLVTGQGSLPGMISVPALADEVGR